MVVRTLCYMGVCDVEDMVWKVQSSRIYLFQGNWMRGLVGGLQNRPGPFDSDIALKFNKIYIMALFGSDWLDDYDSMKEYESSIIHNEDDESISYDKPIFAPIHDEEYDSLKEYERKLH